MDERVLEDTLGIVKWVKTNFDKRQLGRNLDELHPQFPVAEPKHQLVTGCTYNGATVIYLKGCTYPEVHNA